MSKVRAKNNNKVLWVLLLILLVCFGALGFGFYKYFYAGSSTSKYGDRLEGIENYPLSDTLSKDINAVYDGNDNVGDVNVTVEGKIVYIDIDLIKSIKIEEAQTLAIKSLDSIGEKNLTFYDIQFIITYSGEEENENFPIFGSKNASSLKVVW